IFEAADPVELRLVHPVEQLFELGLRLARKADDERAANDEIRAFRAPRFYPRESVYRVRGPAHPLQHRRTSMLERNVEVRQHLPLRHQGNHRVDMWVRIDIVHPHPCAERPEPASEIEEA